VQSWYSTVSHWCWSVWRCVSFLHTQGLLSLLMIIFIHHKHGSSENNKCSWNINKYTGDTFLQYRLCCYAVICVLNDFVTTKFEFCPCSPLSAVTTRRQLRATTQGDLDYPRTRTVTYGSRAFAVSEPTCWNLLPSSLKSPSPKPAHFCKQLKTILMAQPL